MFNFAAKIFRIKVRRLETQSTLEEFLYIENSSIHGEGLFTSIDIPAGTKIILIEGEVIDGFECERREEEDNNVYIFWNGDDCYIDTSGTDKIKYINHNCRFNCDIEENNEYSLILFAYKDIAAGEELTIDYGYDEIYEYCNCEICSRINAAV